MEQLTKCPLCGSDQFALALTATDHVVSKERFDLMDCAGCGFRFTNPRPSPSDLGAYYASESYISHTNSSETLQDKLYQFARRRALKQKHELVRQFQPHGKVLDIGCGTGEFLAHLMSRGYQVAGVEPSLRAREEAIANHGIPVFPGLDDVTAQENIHVVTLWHVLEHLSDIRSTFKRMFALMAERGVLVIAVPDRDSWDAQHYGADWAAWDVPRHLSHFRQSDVEALIEEHGFELVQVRRMWMDALYVSMLSEQYRGASRPVALIKGILIGCWSNLMSVLGDRPSSSSLFIAKKAEF